jgi:hypothetical protein
MKTVSLKLPDSLDAKLTTMAKRKGETKSVIVRQALERLYAREASSQPATCLDLARDLCGIVEGPEDLSTNKEHMRGYGQ